MTISIIEFSVENYKIFKEKQTFSMTTDDTKDKNRFFEKSGEKLLKTSFIYGPNASGKSTLIESVQDLLLFLSGRKKINDIYKPFFLSEKKDEKISFNLVFSIESNNEKNKKYNGIYDYILEFKKDNVVYESLKKIEETGDYNLFERKKNGEEIVLENEFNSKANKDIFNEQTSNKISYIFALSQWKSNFSKYILSILDSKINLINGANSEQFRLFSKKYLESNQDSYIEHLKNADFSISDIEIKSINIPSGLKAKFNNNLGSYGYEDLTKRFFTTHKKYHSKTKKEIDELEFFDLELDESEGTKDFIYKLGPILATLKNGSVLFVDEFDSSLHPLLTRYIVQLFESKKTNPKNAQLIVTTHDTSLLADKSLLIKDQVWFTEKNEFGEGSLFSLGDFEDNDKYLRNDTEYQKKYLEGRFGALPFINDLNL